MLVKFSSFISFICFYHFKDFVSFFFYFFTSNSNSISLKHGQFLVSYTSSSSLILPCFPLLHFLNLTLILIISNLSRHSSYLLCTKLWNLTLILIISPLSHHSSSLLCTPSYDNQHRHLVFLIPNCNYAKNVTSTRGHTLVNNHCPKRSFMLATTFRTHNKGHAK